MNISELSARVKSGERRALARAITLVESGRADHRAAADELLAELAEAGREALRIGLSGTPGVGKSTFIEAFGCRLTVRECGSLCWQWIRRQRVRAVRSSVTKPGWSALRASPAPLSGHRPARPRLAAWPGAPAKR